jgi:hypothetical protein
MRPSRSVMLTGPGRLRGLLIWVGSLLGGLDSEVLGRRMLID